MRIRLAVTTTGGGGHDVVVDAPAGTTLAQLRGPVARATGAAPETSWWSARRVLPDTAVLGGPGLRAGDGVSLSGPAAPEGAPTTPLHLAVTGGPSAGTVLPLSRGVHVVGRGADCDLLLADPEVSRRHLAVTVTVAGVTARDLDSRNGTHAPDGPLDPDGVDLVPGADLRLGTSTVVLRAGPGAVAAVRATDDGRVLVLRPAHDGGGATVRTLTEPAAPPERTRPRIAWVGALLPAVAGVALAWFLHTWQFLAFAALTPLTVLGTAAGDRWSWRSGRRRAAADHATATAAFTADLADVLADEQRHRRALHPDPPACAHAAGGPAAPLWQRRPDDDSAWQVRLGTAPRPSWTRVVAADGTTRPAGTLTDAPVGADLRRGPLGIAGPSGVSVAIARAALVQLAIAHPPGELEFVLLLSDDDGTWDWTRWLPHPVTRAAGPDARAAMVTALAERTRQDRHGGGPRLPSIVVLADRAGAMADLAGLDDLLGRGSAADVHVVCVERTAAALPGACTAVAVTTGATHAVLALGGAGWDGVDGRADVDGPVVADQVTTAWCERLARDLAPLDDGARDDALPRRVRLRDLLDADDAEQVAQRWAAADGTTGALRAAVGVDATGTVHLDLSADGPHALVAGTTGSGKSELLQTWVASLASAHAPDDLAFLLVDYKGGAAFGACARLPHTLGLVTDLDGHLTGRVLRSLDAEIRRRERLFAGTGAADLAAYRRAGGPEPVPRLLLVVDEFATLAADLPDFVPGLVDVAQRGRSLGLHLVLATQRPGHAVSPAIRANSTLRVALRVTDAGESSDVIGVADAAALDPTCPGRAVVRTGSGLGLVQAARVTAPVGGGVDIVAAARVGPWEEPPAPAPAEGSRTDLDDLVDTLAKAWARRWADGAAPPRPTWLPPLPDTLSTAALAALVGVGAVGGAPGGDARGSGDGGSGWCPAIGLRDQPDRQRQPVERLDLAAGGTLLVAGAARTGRTTLLVALSALATAAAVPTVVVDGTGGLTGLRDASGTVAYVPAQADVLVRLVDLLEAETAARAARPTGAPPSPLLVLVDGWAAVAAALDDADGGRATDRLVSLWRTAGSAGITLVVTGDRAVLGTRTASAADRMLVLRLPDRADHAMAGLAPRDVPEHLPPGRGVLVPGGDVVQLALPPSPASPASSGPAARAPGPTLTGLRLRALPSHVVAEPGGPLRHGRELRLGVGGDAADAVTLDPWSGGGRVVVAGPPRSGRSTVLAHLAAEAAAGGAAVRWWARPHTPLANAAAAHGWTALERDADDVGSATRDRVLVVLDDVDDLTDAPVSDAIARALRAAAPGSLAVVCAGRPDELLMSYRGVVAEVRRARRGLLLRPGPGDGELVGVRTGRAAADAPPGRGLLVADGVTVAGAAVGVVPLAVQVAAPRRGTAARTSRAETP